MIIGILNIYNFICDNNLLRNMLAKCHLSEASEGGLGRERPEKLLKRSSKK